MGFKKTGAEPTLLSIAKGRRCEAELFARRIPLPDIPKETKACSDWIHKLYQEKDEIFDYFVRNDTFEGNGLPRTEIPRNYYDLLIELFWIITIGIPSAYYAIKFLMTSSWIAQLIFFIILLLGK